jgi:hypothetical protein
MRKVTSARLPPIAVEERPEKLILAIPPELKTSMDRFGQFFADTSGQTPTSFNAIVVGILTGYLESHKGYRQWLKVRSRGTSPAPPGASSP